MPSRDFSTVDAVERLVVDQLQVAVQQSLSRDFPIVSRNLQVDTHALKWLSEEVVYTFRSFLLNIHKQNKVTTQLYEYPATPLEYLKEKYAPAWVIECWPVRYDRKEIETSVERNYMCPHLDVKDDDHRHIFWLYQMNK